MCKLHVFVDSSITFAQKVLRLYVCNIYASTILSVVHNCSNNNKLHTSYFIIITITISIPISFLYCFIISVDISSSHHRILNSIPRWDKDKTVKETWAEESANVINARMETEFVTADKLPCIKYNLKLECIFSTSNEDY